MFLAFRQFLLYKQRGKKKLHALHTNRQKYFTTKHFLYLYVFFSHKKIMKTWHFHLKMASPQDSQDVIHLVTMVPYTSVKFFQNVPYVHAQASNIQMHARALLNNSNITNDYTYDSTVELLVKRSFVTYSFFS